MCCKFRSNSAVSKTIRAAVKAGGVLYRMLMIALGPLLFVIVILLVLTATLMFYGYILPGIKASSLVHYLSGTVGAWISLNILFNYVACALTRPGPPTNYSTNTTAEEPLRLLKVGLDKRYADRVVYEVFLAPLVSYKYCHTCLTIKPPRAHHCRCLLLIQLFMNE